ncbi:MAG TPA: galactose ABC transporter substrate-binding protein [Caproicibacter sp.]|nr:galactose ABC transporter substrate-binding protein [Caproicibacter sp.]
MNKKVISMALSIALIATAFTGCSGSSNSTQSAASGGASAASAASASSSGTKILGAGIYSASDNFNSYIGKAITNASKGVFQTNIEDGQNDQSTQNNEVDTMLAKGASAVALSVVDVTAAPTLIQKCKDAGNIPMIFFNKEITDQSVIASYDKAYQVTSTGGDYGANIEGQEIIDYWKAHPEMDKNHDGKLQLIDLMGDPGHTATKPRADAVKNTLTKAGIKYDLLAEDTGMWVTATAKDKMDAWISKYGNQVECIVCANDAMALGALSSIEAAGFNSQGTKSSKYIPIFGIDALPEMLSKIQSGEIAGSVLQDSKTQGQVIVKMAQNLVDGKDVMTGINYKLESGSKAVRIPYKAITLKNLDEAKAAYN